MQKLEYFIGVTTDVTSDNGRSFRATQSGENRAFLIFYGADSARQTSPDAGVGASVMPRPEARRSALGSPRMPQLQARHTCRRLPEKPSDRGPRRQF